MLLVQAVEDPPLNLMVSGSMPDIGSPKYFLFKNQMTFDS